MSRQDNERNRGPLKDIPTSLTDPQVIIPILAFAVMATVVWLIWRMT